ADRGLLGEVDTVEHARGLDDPAQLHLAPRATGLRRAQSRDELARLATQQLGGLTHLGDLLGKRAVALDACALGRVDLFLDRLEGLGDRLDERAHGLLALRELGLLALPCP